MFTEITENTEIHKKDTTEREGKCGHIGESMCSLMFPERFEKNATARPVSR